jgi:hypothetical protein
VPPPPVSGAAVGYAGVAGADVCVGAGVVGAWVVGAWVGVAGAELEACVELGVLAELEAGAELGALAEVDAWGEPEADAPPPAVEVALDEPLDDLEASPVGDGVRVPAVDEECPPVSGVGARRTAPAAERPAISHAPWAATGGNRSIFMNPPRMRVR